LAHAQQARAPLSLFDNVMLAGYFGQGRHPAERPRDLIA